MRKIGTLIMFRRAQRALPLAAQARLRCATRRPPDPPVAHAEAFRRAGST
jgi:hypothetical protein